MKIKNHECFLDQQDEEVLVHFIGTGVCISLRRKIRSWCMIYEEHPQTRSHFKSYAACRNEDVRQLAHYYNMIHPFSILNLGWEFLMFFVFMLHYILMAIYSTIMGETSNISHVNYASASLDLIQLFDIVKLFFTGYYDDERSKVILNFYKIARRYLLTHFIFDVLSSLYSYCFLIAYMGIAEEFFTRFVLLRLLTRLKIFRLNRCLNALELFRKFMGYSSYVFNGIKVVLIFVTMVCWTFSITFFVEKFIKYYYTHGKFESLIKGYYQATTSLVLADLGGSAYNADIKFLNYLVFLLTGFCLQLFLYAQILQVWTKYINSENKYLSLQKQLNEYMQYKSLPIKIRKRFTAYFQFKFHKAFYKDSDIRNMVSPLLMQELLYHNTRSNIEKVEFFKTLPDKILIRLINQLKSEVYLPGDVVISAGTPGSSMFFIYHGTVAVYSPNGKEVCHLEDGAHFGEIALLLNETRVANVVTVTTSELLVLTRSGFLTAIEPFPEFMEILLAMARERLYQTFTKPSEQHVN